MQIFLYFSYLIAICRSASPVPPKRKCGLSGRELIKEYKYNNVTIQVSCTYSPCRTKCIFSSTELGEVVFHRNHKVLLSSSRPIDARYIKFLGGTLDQWEKHFDDFDLRPYLQSWEERKK